MQTRLIKLFSKRLSFIPLLIVLFLLIVSAVTSYVVINQGTGGYKSRAAGTSSNIPNCSTVACRFGTPSQPTLSQCTNTGTLGNYCQYTSGTNTTKDGCNPKTIYLQPNNSEASFGHNIAYYNCRAGSYCENSTQCISGLTCKNNFCAVPPPPSSTSTAIPACDQVGEICCSSVTAGVVDRFCKNSANDLKCNGNTSGSTCVKKTSADPKPPADTGGGGGTGTTGGDYGQGDGKCASTFSGATCKNTSACTGTIQTGYCPGPDTWKCCVPPADPKPPAGTKTCAGGILCDGTPVTGTAGQTVCGQKDTGGTCRTSQCNGSTGVWDYIAAACTMPIVTPSTTPTPTPVPGGGGGGGGTGTTSPTPTAGASGDVKLNLTLKLQGVTAQPRGSQTVPFKVKLKGPSTKDYVTGTLTANAAGKWTGSVAFTGITVGADTKYTIYVKVGKHLQKRVCGFAPTETSGGLYNCADSTIPLAAGENNLDFSGIMLLAGDLPSSTGVQNGVVDSYDKGFVLNHQRSTNSADLAIGDLNFDGAIDTNDWSLILQSLNVKYDDE